MSLNVLGLERCGLAFEVSASHLKKSKCLGLAKKNVSLAFTIHLPFLSEGIQQFAHYSICAGKTGEIRFLCFKVVLNNKNNL